MGTRLQLVDTGRRHPDGRRAGGPDRWALAQRRCRRRCPTRGPPTDQPDPEDAYLRPSGPLGALTSASLAGVFLGEFDTTQQAEQAIRAEMDRTRFWPNVWWVDDHGGLTLWPLDPADHPPGEAQ